MRKPPCGAKTGACRWRTHSCRVPSACGGFSGRLDPLLPIPANEGAGGAVVLELRFFRTLQFRDDALCQHFAQFDAPLVERIDVPDGGLSKHGMLVQSDELSEYAWR